MLSTVRFENIKTLKQIELGLERLTVIVGPNGCGKSTLLDQIELLCRCSHPDPQMRSPLGMTGLVLEPLPLARMRTTGADQGLFWQGVAHDQATVTVRVPLISNQDWTVATNTIFSYPQILPVELPNANTPIAKARSEANHIIQAHFAWRAQRLRLVPDQIAQPVDIRIQELDPSGYGLPAMLAELALNDQVAYSNLQADLRLIVPQFEKLRISKTNLPNQQSSTGGVALNLQMRGAGLVPAEAVSDGTLLALALLTATHAPEAPPIVLMDDIDHGLHLGAQFAMVQAIRKVMEVRPALQVVCTSHSPYLLDAVTPEEVRVMGLDQAGHAHIRPLTAYPKFEKYRRGLQTGELWASVGEDWVTEVSDG